MQDFEFAPETTASFARLSAFVQRVQRQFMEDPCASLHYFKHAYSHNKLDHEFMNAPGKW